MTVVVGDDGVLVRTSGTGPLLLHLDGRYVWSFTPERDGLPALGGVLVPWPGVLRPYLDGSARVVVTDVSGDRAYVDEDVVLGSGEGRIAVVDQHGHPLSVDKVGHLTRSFEATDEAIREEILAGTERAVADLRDACGVEAYLNYGALLGAVREGRMLAHDSDTDLCYYSRYTTPVDVILESYRVEKTMLRLGWNVLRMSAGDIKLLLPLSDGRMCHIDVFAAFHVAGVFYQFGNRSGSLPREAVVPPSSIELHGHTFPAPADPEAMLAFLYGTGWRVPDPSFKYADPRAGIRRLDGWFRGFRTYMPHWTEHWTEQHGTSLRPSEFALWVLRRTAAGDKILDLGAGSGADAVFIAQHDRQVWAVDYSRQAIRMIRARSRKRRGPVRADRLVLGELRHVLWLGATLAREPHHLYARHLIGTLEDDARAQLWRLASMALRRQGQLFLEFSAGSIFKPPSGPDGLVKRLEPSTVAAEIVAAGGRIEHREVTPGRDVLGGPDPSVCRLVAAFDHAERTTS